MKKNIALVLFIAVIYIGNIKADTPIYLNSSDISLTPSYYSDYHLVFSPSEYSCRFNTTLRIYFSIASDFGPGYFWAELSDNAVSYDFGYEDGRHCITLYIPNPDVKTPMDIHFRIGGNGDYANGVLIQHDQSFYSNDVTVHVSN